MDETLNRAIQARLNKVMTLLHAAEPLAEIVESTWIINHVIDELLPTLPENQA